MNDPMNVKKIVIKIPAVESLEIVNRSTGCFKLPGPQPNCSYLHITRPSCTDPNRNF